MPIAYSLLLPAYCLDNMQISLAPIAAVSFQLAAERDGRFSEKREEAPNKKHQTKINYHTKKFLKFIMRA